MFLQYQPSDRRRWLHAFATWAIVVAMAWFAHALYTKEVLPGRADADKRRRANTAYLNEALLADVPVFQSITPTWTRLAEDSTFVWASGPIQRLQISRLEAFMRDVAPQGHQLRVTEETYIDAFNDPPRWWPNGAAGRTSRRRFWHVQMLPVPGQLRQAPYSYVIGVDKKIAAVYVSARVDG